MFRWQIVVRSNCYVSFLFALWTRLMASALVLAVSACRSEPAPPSQGFAYVRGAEQPLRDQLGPSSHPIATLQGGDRVEVLARRSRWVQVRAAAGQGGWIHSESLVSQETFDRFQKLAKETASLPSQGTALARRDANLHLEPSRNSEVFHLLREEEVVEVVSHRAAERASPGESRAAPRQDVEPGAESSDQVPAQVYVRQPENWLLVRDTRPRAGWVRESFLDMNVPLEVAQYSEGLRIRAWFVLHVEQDPAGEHPWYLWATVDPRPGLPYDFDEIRVFVWNPRNTRYETSYRERNLIGFYPIQVTRRETPAGVSPAFTLHLEDETGRRFQKNYVMAGRVVRPQP
ncbi:MAG: SH3 domain-containing protein [Acidobacteria bacterium]|nr:SH3 domain-containing protein [Acidobacteriota bacterium]